MKARIRYQQETEKEREGYSVELWLDDDWCFDSFYPLVRRENAKEEEERNFVHFKLVNKINELQQYGYKIFFK